MASTAPHVSAPNAAKYPFTRLGLTGGIASGKTTVMEMFRALGAETIDTDAIAHEVLEKDSEARHAVIEAFGRGIVEADGSIGRSRLGEVVFGDTSKRALLNGIVHPAIRRRWLGQIDALAQRGFAGVVVVGIPLLYEVKAEEFFDVTLVIACTEKTQVQRLLQRGLTETQARQRITAQLPMQEKMTRADYVIWNESPVPVLEQQVRLVWKKLNSSTD